MEKEFIKIAQLSDIHLLSEKHLEKDGINPYNHLKTIANKIAARHYDHIFISGDISDDGSIESYQLVKEIFDNINTPVHCIPGNHDKKINMEKVFSKSHYIKMPETLSMPYWDIIFLDTTVENQVHGLLNQKELEKLQKNIKSSKAPNIGIVMHHHPYPIGNAHMDELNLKNTPAFEKIINQTKVKFVTFGHVHHYYSFKVDNIQYESTPATNFQIKKDQSGFIIEKIYGFKELIFSKTDVTSNCIWNEN